MFAIHKVSWLNWTERMPTKHGVGGSNPSGTANNAGVAQW